MREQNPESDLPVNADFRTRLWYQIVKQGYSIRRLSYASGVKANTIETYLLNKRMPRMNNLIALAKTLNCSLDWLCGLKEEP